LLRGTTGVFGSPAIALSEHLFSQPNPHGAVAVFEQFHLVAAHRDASLGPAALHRFGKLRTLPALLNSSGGNVKKTGQVLVGALQHAQLFQHS
jgi:hypothetical protein